MVPCNKCVHTRLIISENGLHPVCTLSPKAANKCLLNGYSELVVLDEWDVIPIEPILEPLINKQLRRHFRLE